MRKKDELSNPSSCLNKARDNEWIFVILERDDTAVETVEFWRNKRIEKGINKASDAKMKEAEEWIDSVLASRSKA